MCHNYYHCSLFPSPHAFTCFLFVWFSFLILYFTLFFPSPLFPSMPFSNSTHAPPLRNHHTVQVHVFSFFPLNEYKYEDQWNNWYIQNNVFTIKRWLLNFLVNTDAGYLVHTPSFLLVKFCFFLLTSCKIFCFVFFSGCKTWRVHSFPLFHWYSLWKLLLECKNTMIFLGLGWGTFFLQGI